VIAATNLPDDGASIPRIENEWDRRRPDGRRRREPVTGVERTRSRRASPTETGERPEAADLDPESFDEDELVRTADGELIHEETGLVVESDPIDRGPEWRAFGHEERESRSRVGAPTTPTRHDRGLTTEIDWRDRDAHGRSLSAEKRSRMQRLRTWQERIRTENAGERNLQFALSEIDRMASALGVPKSVREVASVIYRRALDEDLVRGRSIEGVATAALYAACRQERLPRSLDETTRVARVGRREVGRTYRHVAAELELGLEPVDPCQYVPRFCSALDLSSAVARRAREVVEVAAGRGLLSGKSPTGYAAAAIYLAALIEDEKRTQHEVAAVAEVTEVTVRNRYQEQRAAFASETGIEVSP
jgi:transcription initiation factor TFIIB